MTLDNSTGIENNAKQASLDLILHNINQMHEYGVESDIISEEVRGITLEDISKYMKKVEVDQDSPIKLLTINSVDIPGLTYTNDIYNDFQTYPLIQIPPQRVYFIEGGSFALVMIPIPIQKDIIQIILQPLEKSAPYIQDEYKRIVEKRDSKGKTSLEELKKKISFVKFPKQK